MSKFKRIIAAILMLAMLISSMPVLAEEMVELTPDQIAELTGSSEVGEPEAVEEPEVDISDAESAEPTEVPTEELSVEASEQIAEEPTESSGIECSVEPSAEPTLEPEEKLNTETVVESTAEPMAEPTAEPSVEPIEIPVIELENDLAGMPDSIVPQTAQELAAYAGLSLEELAAEFGVSEDELNTLSAEEISALYEQINAMMTDIAMMSVEATSDFIIDDEGTLTAYVGADTHVEIPEGVVAIGDSVFKNNTLMTSVEIPSSVKEIGSDCFSGCTGLTNLVIPESVISLGDGWSGSAFYNCTGLVSVTISNGLNSIPDSTFYGCSSLESVVIPEGIVVIENAAFMDCTSLKTVYLPTSLEEMAITAFNQCHSLQGFYVSEGNEDYCSIDGVLYSADKETVIKYPNAKGSEYTIREGVKRIGEEAFSFCDNMAMVHFPNSIKEIGGNAFWSSGLKSAIVPQGITKIEFGVFQWCSELEAVVLPDTIESIGVDAFAKCESLRQLDIPKAVESIGENAFYNCTDLVMNVYQDSYALQYCIDNNFSYCINSEFEIVNGVLVGYVGTISEVTIPNGVTAIGKNVFANHDEIVKVTIPEGVKSIGSFAFSGCTNVKEFSFPKSLNEIGEWTFQVCDTLKSITVPGTIEKMGQYAFANCENLESVIIEEGVRQLAFCAFLGCAKLKKVSIPSSITEIGPRAFYDCSGLSEVAISNGAKTIGKEAFANCLYLANVNIPDSVSNIQDKAFDYCVSLESIAIPKSVTKIGADVFVNCSDKLVVSVYEGSSAHSYCMENGIRYEIICEKHRAECSAPNTCIDCGEEVSKAELIHGELDSAATPVNYQYHTYACIGCGEGLLQEEHKYTDGICNACGASECKHYANCTLPDYCAVCEEKISALEVRHAEDAMDGEPVLCPDDPSAHGYYCELCQNYLNLEVHSVACNSENLEQCEVCGTEISEEYVQHIGLRNDYETVEGDPDKHGVYCTTCKKYIKVENHIAVCGSELADQCLVCHAEIEESKRIHSEEKDIQLNNSTKKQHDVFCARCGYLEYSEEHYTEGEDKDHCAVCGIGISEEGFLYEINLENQNIILGYIGESTEVVVPTLLKEMQVAQIDYDAFRNNSSIKTLVIPDGIGDNSWGGWSGYFKGCSSLESITLPDKAIYESDWEEIFSGCEKLKDVNVSENNPAFKSIEGIVYNKDGSKLIYFPQARSGKFEVAQNVHAIGNDAFAESKLSEIVLSENIQEIGERAFENAASVTIVVKQDSYAHRYCLANGALFKVLAEEIRLNRSYVKANLSEGEIALMATVEPESAGRNVKWGSSDESVATVSNGIVKLVGAGTVIISCETTDGTDLKAECTIEVAEAEVNTSIVLDKNTLSMEVGDTAIRLKATVTPESSASKLAWSSSDPAVATVSADGIIKAVSGGVAVITCKVNDGSDTQAHCIVTVGENTVDTTVVLDRSALTMKVGDAAVSLKATVTPVYTSSKLVWTSSEPSIASVNSSGKVTAVSGGIAIITCKVNDGSNAQAHCIVTVNEDIRIEKISLNKSFANLNLSKAETLELYARISPGNAANQKIIWTSSNSSVASVNSMGVVMAVSEGTAVITCTSAENADVKASCTVTVTSSASGQRIELNKRKAVLNLASYEVCALSAKVYPENAENKALIWESENPSVAVVTASGLVVPLSEGTVKIICYIEGNPAVSASCEITVIRRIEMCNIILFDRDVKIDWSADETHYLQHIILPSNATEKQLIWMSSNPAVATVAEGVITPVSVGTAIISCHAVADKSINAACNVTVYSSRKPDDISILATGKRVLDVGETMQLGYTFTPAKSYAEVSWSSSNKAVARVDENGFVNALAEGETRISVSTFNGKTETFTIRVIDPEKPTGIVLECGDKLTIGAGEEIQLNADIQPETAVAELDWHSNTKYVTVDDDGLIKGIRKGKAIITVTATGEDGTKVSNHLKVEVKYAPTNVKLNVKKGSLAVSSEPVQLKAAISSQCASVFYWESSDESVAKVNENGVVTPVAPGEAVIICSTFNGKTAECAVTVTPDPTRIDLPAAEINMHYSQILNLNAQLVDDEGISCYGEIRYESSHPKNVAVDDNGNVKVKKKAPGTAEIFICSDNGLEETVVIHVCRAPDSVALEEKEIDLGKGEMYQITPIIGENEATSFTFSSSNKRVAKVAKDGTITAMGKGKAIITVKTHNGKTDTVKIKVF